MTAAPTPTDRLWPFLFSVTPRGIVRNGPPEATQPQPKQRQARAAKVVPQGQEARW